MKKILLAAFIVTAALFVSGYFEPDYTISYETHYLQAGQTVWEIAQKTIRKSDKRMTLDDYMASVYEANKWQRMPKLEAGDKVVLPIYTEVKK